MSFTNYKCRKGFRPVLIPAKNIYILKKSEIEFQQYDENTCILKLIKVYQD